VTRGRLTERLAAAKRAAYRDGRPRGLMRLLHALDRPLYGTRLAPHRTAVLRVRGRRSGRMLSTPVAIAVWRGRGHLVSMLGPTADWVGNVRAADGVAVLRHRGRDTPVRLHEVPVAERAEILRRYATIAPAARPHLGLGPRDALAAFARIAPGHPVFRIERR